jgi:hypothetical protein
LNYDATNLQSPAPGAYISLTVHIWVNEDGGLIRGTIEDVHTGARLALDFSSLIAFLRESLAHAHVWNAQEEENSIEKGGSQAK